MTIKHYSSTRLKYVDTNGWLSRPPHLIYTWHVTLCHAFSHEMTIKWNNDSKRSRSLTCRDDHKTPLINASFTDDSTINTTMRTNIHIRLIWLARKNRVWFSRFEPATSHPLGKVCEIRRDRGLRGSVDYIPVVRRRIRHDGRSRSFRERSLRYVTESKLPLRGITSRFLGNVRSKAFSASFRHANENRHADVASVIPVACPFGETFPTNGAGVGDVAIPRR